jgi:hypothetical protein
VCPPPYAQEPDMPSSDARSVPSRPNRFLLEEGEAHRGSNPNRTVVVSVCKPCWAEALGFSPHLPPVHVPKKKRSRGPFVRGPFRMLSEEGGWQPPFQTILELGKRRDTLLEFRWPKPEGESWIGDLRALTPPDTALEEALQDAFVHWVAGCEDDPAAQAYALDLMSQRMLVFTQVMCGG